LALLKIWAWVWKVGGLGIWGPFGGVSPIFNLGKTFPRKGGRKGFGPRKKGLLKGWGQSRKREGGHWFTSPKGKLLTQGVLKDLFPGPLNFG